MKISILKIWKYAACLLALMVASACSSQAPIGDNKESPEASQSESPKSEEKDRLGNQYFEEHLPKFFHAGIENANYLKGWDYDSCAEVESTRGSLDDIPCEYATEIQYEVKKERTMFSLLFLKYPSDSIPRERKSYSARASHEDVDFQDDSVLEGSVNEADSKAKWAGDFVVLIRASTTSSDAKLQDYAEQAASTIKIFLVKVADKD